MTSKQMLAKLCRRLITIDFMNSDAGEQRGSAVAAHKISLGHPSDVSGLERLVRESRLDPNEVVAVVGKTQGSGDRFDTTRMDADRALRRALLELGSSTPGQVEQIPMVFSSGAVGLLDPNAVVFTRTPGVPVVGSGPRLTIGTAQTAPILDAERGRAAMVGAVADSVREAAASAGIDPRDTAYVLGKSCLPALTDFTPIEHGDAGYDDMATVLSTSGATALGIGIAVGDVAGPIRDADVVANSSLWSARASTSTGHENPETQIVLLGNRLGAGGSLQVGHSVMSDALDVSALMRAVRDAGLDVPETHIPEDLRKRIVAVFIKGGTPGPTLRGHRQVQEAENPHYIAQVKATIGGIVASAIGDPALYISGAAVHQAPAGGGNIAVIVDHGEI